MDYNKDLEKRIEKLEEALEETYRLLDKIEEESKYFYKMELSTIVPPNVHNLSTTTLRNVEEVSSCLKFVLDERKICLSSPFIHREKMCWSNCDKLVIKISCFSSFKRLANDGFEGDYKKDFLNHSIFFGTMINLLCNKTECIVNGGTTEFIDGLSEIFDPILKMVSDYGIS